MAGMVERRKHRSDIPHEAVSLLLEAAAARSGATAAALADQDGLLLGGAGGDGGLDLERLAALGAERARWGADPAPVDALVEAFAGAEDLYASGIRLGARVYTLTSLGARVRRQQEVAAGLTRILAPILTSAA